MIPYAKLSGATRRLSVLLIEDYRPFAEEMEEVLSDLFSVVTVAYDGEEGLASYQAYRERHGKHYDIVLTDIRLPKTDGVQVCKVIRSIHPAQEIIVVSAYTETEDLLELINVGVRRFIRKPLVYDELCDALSDAANVCTALSGEAEKEEYSVFFAEGCRWDRQRSELYRDGNVVYCTGHELVLLEFLVESRGMVCTVGGIIDYFDSRNVSVNQKTIRNLILKLRQKIDKNFIENIYGLGYRLRRE